MVVGRDFDEPVVGSHDEPVVYANLSAQSDPGNDHAMDRLLWVEVTLLVVVFLVGAFLLVDGLIRLSES